MTDVSKAELALTLAKAECFKACGHLDPNDLDLLDAAHEPHRQQLENAYAAFQRANGVNNLGSNPAPPGTTQVAAILTVETGLN